MIYGNRKKKETGHTNNLWSDITKILNFVPSSVARLVIYNHILASIELKCSINWATLFAYCALFYCALSVVYLFDLAALFNLRGM